MIAKWWQGGRRRGRSVVQVRVPALEGTLLAAIQAGLLLLLITPLLVTPSTYFPFVVGKALFARSAIEVVVALWAALALLSPAYRPRRSLVLLLLAAGLAWSMVAALLGASPQRSFWSNYERMQGVIDAAHWAALAMVAACVLRRPGQWLVLLNGSLAVGLAVSLLAVCQYLGVKDLPLVGEFLLEHRVRRPGSTLGNPIYLGVYAVLNAFVAFGLLAWACQPRQAGAPAGSGHRRQGRAARGSASGRAPGRTRRGWMALAVLWYGGSGMLHLWVGLLAQSRGPIMGALFGLLVLAIVGALLVRSRRWRLLALGAVAAVLLIGSTPLLFDRFAPPGAIKSIDSKVLRRLLRLSFDDRTVQTRWTAWQTGFQGLAERPLTGWGPENFLVAFARYGKQLPARMQPHDAAHGAMVERFTTEGAVGGLLRLMLWAAVVIVLVRAARAARGRERTLILTVGTALAAYFATVQTLFATPVGSMQLYLLLGFAAGLEQRARPAPEAGPAGAPLQTGPLVAAAALWALAGAGLWANQSIHQAAVAFRQAIEPSKSPTQTRKRFDRAVSAFEPLASQVRLELLNTFMRRLHGAPALLEATLPWLEEQAAAALAAEPHNWRLRLTVARLYSVVAETDPDYLPQAQAQADRLLELVPEKKGVLAVYGRPKRAGPLTVSAASDGLRFDWPKRMDALTYRLAHRPAGGRWRPAYEGAASEVVLVPQAEGQVSYRVRGCFGHGNCGAWSNLVVIEPAAPPPPGDAAPHRPSTPHR